MADISQYTNRKVSYIVDRNRTFEGVFVNVGRGYIRMYTNHPQAGDLYLYEDVSSTTYKRCWNIGTLEQIEKKLEKIKFYE